jgi:2-methylisocitrate lyase-like PEP mutase family enzyme
MNDTFKLFQSLHQQKEPLLMGNAWNAQSAKILENQNFKAIGTSSAAVAESIGYEDGEQMSFDEYLFVIKRIKASTSIPLTVDMEGGYGKTIDEIVNNINRLHAIGVAGINIEDSVINNGKREIVDAEEFAKKLKSITTKLKSQNINLFINLRCDAFLLGLDDPRNEAIKRIILYDKTGVHGIFLPCITELEDIKSTVSATALPVNVMCMPHLPDFNTLQSLGVKRISIGPFLSRATYKKMEELTQTITKEKSFSCLF